MNELNVLTKKYFKSNQTIWLDSTALISQQFLALKRLKF